MKLKTFTADPKTVAKYGLLEDEAGQRRFKVRLRSEARGLVIARLAEVIEGPPGGEATEKGPEDRNAAEAIKGLRLYVGRDRLPKPKRGEWYLSDLVGLRAERSDGTPLGVVTGTMNYGAGDILEVETTGGQSLLLPFTKTVAPEVDVEHGRIVIEPPMEVEWKPENE